MKVYLKQAFNQSEIEKKQAIIKCLQDKINVLNNFETPYSSLYQLVYLQKRIDTLKTEIIELQK